MVLLTTLQLALTGTKKFHHAKDRTTEAANQKQKQEKCVKTGTKIIQPESMKLKEQQLLEQMGPITIAVILVTKKMEYGATSKTLKLSSYVILCHNWRQNLLQYKKKRESTVKKMFIQRIE